VTGKPQQAVDNSYDAGHLAIPEVWNGPKMRSLGSFELRAEPVRDVAILKIQSEESGGKRAGELTRSQRAAY
jgi:hypothetical protein